MIIDFPFHILQIEPYDMDLRSKIRDQFKIKITALYLYCRILSGDITDNLKNYFFVKFLFFVTVGRKQNFLDKILLL
jgi:hypothetical protein